MKPLFLALPLAAAVTGSTACARATEPPRRPNVLFIAVDDLRPELGAYGNQDIRSPNIDRLARQGVVFTQAHVQQAVCNPSRASLLTGLRPDTTRVWDLATDFRTRLPDAVTLPQYFARQGYHSVGIGKIFHNNIPDPASWSEPKLHIDGYPFDPDAVYRGDESLAYVEKRKQEIIAAGQQERHIDQYGLWYLKAAATESLDIPDNVYYDGAQTDVAVAKLEDLSRRNEPFFFGIGYYRPHLPFNAPKRYWDLYDRQAIPLAENPFVPKGAPLVALNTLRELRGYMDLKDARHPADGGLDEPRARLLKHGYYASVSYVDAQIGRLLDTLDALAIADRTIVVLWGDHGWKLGEHRSWAKMTNYEIDTRAPLIISSPSLGRAGTRVDRLVEFVDIYPTLCELAGLAVPSGLEGVSAVPVMRDPTRPWKTAVFSQFLRDGVWMAPDGTPYMGYAIRTDRYRYVEWFDWRTKARVARELYDHATDPREDENVVDQPGHAATVADLAAALKAGWRSARPADRQ